MYELHISHRLSYSTPRSRCMFTYLESNGVVPQAHTRGNHLSHYDCIPHFVQSRNKVSFPISSNSKAAFSVLRIEMKPAAADWCTGSSRSGEDHSISSPRDFYRCTEEGYSLVERGIQSYTPLSLPRREDRHHHKMANEPADHCKLGSSRRQLGSYYSTSRT